MRDDLNYQNKIIESLFVEIEKEVLGKDKNVIVGVVYRPPDTDIKLFNECFTEILSVVKAENKLPYLLGDFNINLLNVNNHPPSQEFIDIMYSHSLFPTITKPSRVTHSSATLIDNIFCESVMDPSDTVSGIFYTDVSDHFPVFHIDCASTIKTQPQIIKRRTFTQKKN